MMVYLNIFTGPGLEFVSVVEPSSVPGAIWFDREGEIRGTERDR